MLAIIGQVIRQLREENGITQEELASRAGISADKLAKIENNEVNASLGVLIRIARALGAKVSSLMAGKEDDHTAVVTRRNEMADNLIVADDKTDHNDHLHLYALAAAKSDRNMEPMVVEMTPSGRATLPELRSEHSGQEFVYVLEGQATLYYGDQTYTLQTGDSIYYDSALPHVMVNETQNITRLLAVVYTPY